MFKVFRFYDVEDFDGMEKEIEEYFDSYGKQLEIISTSITSSVIYDQIFQVSHETLTVLVNYIMKGGE